MNESVIRCGNTKKGGEKKATEKQSVSLKVKAAAVSGRICNIARIRLYLSFRGPTLSFSLRREKNKSGCVAEHSVFAEAMLQLGGTWPLE